MKAELAKYDALIDLLVDALVREVEENEQEKPAAPWQALQRVEDTHANDTPTAAAT
jgi:hypothetical protein